MTPIEAVPSPGQTLLRRDTSRAEFTRVELLRYGFFAAPLAMAALPIYVHVPKLYAELGLPLATLGLLLLVLRLADAAIDPWLGRLSDALPTRLRACLLAGALLLVGMLMLLNPQRSPLPLWPWLALALILVYLGFSLATIAHGAWGAERPHTPAARTTLTTTREGIGLIGVLFAAALPALLGAGDLAKGLASFSWVFAAALVLALLLLRGVSEDKRPAPRESALAVVLRDDRFRALLVVFALNGIASAIPATLILFFIDDVLQAASWQPVFLIAYFLAGALSMPLWAWLARRLGKVRAWAFGMGLAIAAFCWAVSFGAGDRIPFLLVCIATGIALGADLSLPPSLLADAIARRGTQAFSGSYFGVWAFVTKANLALAAGVALPTVAWFGYREGDAASNLGALTVAYTLFPCALKAIALAILLHFQQRLHEASA